MTITILSIFVLLLAWPGTSYAYLDPGSGSIIFQIIMASVISALVAIRMFWTNIKGLFGIRNSTSSEMEDSHQDIPPES